jgi:hypothetical protein
MTRTPITTEEVERRGKAVRELLIDLTDDDRMAVLCEADFCKYCGSDTKDGGCCCTRDD